MESDEVFDVVLVGGGIMSATLGAMLAKLFPEKSILLLERLDAVGEESSSSWNNAGTGHAGLCELNYMPNPDDPTRASTIADQYEVSRRFWAELIDDGDLPGAAFLTSTPHMNVVFGDDVDYLRTRFETLRRIPAFADMEYTEDLEKIRRWAPLVMDGRASSEHVAATRSSSGEDVDFGALTTALVQSMARRGARIETGCDVTGIRRRTDGRWTVTVKGGRKIDARFVFVGAGGYALRLLQKSKIPEVHGYGVFPFGAEFLRTDVPAVVDRHSAKVYGKAALGAPPMSLPHLDRRHVEGRASLMFGPYATFSSRLLKHGRLTDLFSTVTRRNLPILLSVGLRNLPLVRYLVGQLLSTRTRKFRQLQRYWPAAYQAEWYPMKAGQRAQLIKPTSKFTGELMFGTEIVTGADGTIAGLLGASPGASIAPSAMREVIQRCFAIDGVDAP